MSFPTPTSRNSTMRNVHKIGKIGFQGDQRQTLFVAEEDGEVVGIALGDPEQHLLPDSDYEAELAILHVRTAHHSRGIGRQLLQALARYYLERGIKSMILITLEKNTRARRFYEKHGAQLLATRDWDQNAEYGSNVMDVVYGWLDISLLCE
ncbi:MAG: GNAT family N-acetyltransferase [Anaerolineae bacterium]|nr:GNAT family N-acetyltransferase [Anaerolineae bacterium]